MDILINLLFWVHLVMLVVGGASAVAMPVLNKKLQGASPEVARSLMEVGQRLMVSGRGALVILLITGPLIFWLRWSFTAPNMTWFGIKMLLVIVLIVCMIVGGIAYKKALAGDMSTLPRARLFGQISGLALAGVVLAAVFSFS
ncbi:MAG TPA: hypothetical protein VGM83_04495 [Devosiaceae bacterium]|jgi:uncharacterized membrane protein